VGCDVVIYLMGLFLTSNHYDQQCTILLFTTRTLSLLCFLFLNWYEDCWCDACMQRHWGKINLETRALLQCLLNRLQLDNI
jgi:hypothetical protein